MKATIINSDCLVALRGMDANSVHCCVTSPPYWGLRDYGVEGQIGLERTPEKYVARMVEVFREVRRVLREDGTLWLNLGDSYSRDQGKCGSGPNGKHDFIPDYGNARRHMSESKGSSDGAVGRGDRAAVRVGTGLAQKQLVGIPWRVAFALQADGWWLRQDIIWHKPNPMPESVTDRCTKAHEYIFLLTKSARYFYDAKAIHEPVACPDDVGRVRNGRNMNGTTGNSPTTTGGDFTRNRRSVWTVTTQPYSEAHFATFPPDLIKPCILAGSPTFGTVLDPFGGSGTTGMVALELGRKAILIELNPEYVKLAENRCRVTMGLPL